MRLEKASSIVNPHGRELQRRVSKASRIVDAHVITQVALWQWSIALCSPDWRLPHITELDMPFEHDNGI